MKAPPVINASTLKPFERRTEQLAAAPASCRRIHNRKIFSPQGSKSMVG
jgi:hypothetical protein